MKPPANTPKSVALAVLLSCAFLAPIGALAPDAPPASDKKVEAAAAKTPAESAATNAPGAEAESDGSAKPAAVVADVGDGASSKAKGTTNTPSAKTQIAKAKSGSETNSAASDEIQLSF